MQRTLFGNCEKFMKTRIPQAIKILVLAASSALGAAGAGAQAAPVAGDAVPPGYTRSRSPGVYVRRVPRPAASQPGTAGKATGHGGGIVLRNRRRARRPQDGIVSDVDPASFPNEVATITAEGRIRYGHGHDGHPGARSPRPTNVAAKGSSGKIGVKKPAAKAVAKR